MATVQEQKAIQSRKYLGWACLFAGFLPWLLWQFLYQSQWLYQWWQPWYGKVSNGLFFRLEEFFATMSPNSIAILVSSWMFLLLGLSAMLHLTRGRRKWHESVLAICIFFMMLLVEMPCLCVSGEHVHRAICNAEFKQTFITFYEKDEETLPEYIDIKQKHPHDVVYRPAGKSLASKERFIILEDAPRSHAGDLRHRLWSDGTVEAFYPWKEKNEKKQGK